MMLVLFPFLFIMWIQDAQYCSNLLKILRSTLLSFVICNIHDNIECVGSGDGSSNYSNFFVKNKVHSLV